MPDSEPKRRRPAPRPAGKDDPPAAPEQRKVVVFCGSREGSDPRRVRQAHLLGWNLARDGWQVVTGGGGIGLMGAVNGGVLAKRGATMGIVPGFLTAIQPVQAGLGKLETVVDNFERKRMMIGSVDAGIALPGGLGTIDEISDFVLLRHLGQHEMPLLLMDIDGYWGPLFAMFDRMIAQGFLDKLPEGAILRVPDANAAADALRHLFPPPDRRSAAA